MGSEGICSLLVFFNMIYDMFVPVCPFFAPSVRHPEYSHDRFGCQRCRGVRHSSHLLQVNSRQQPE